jgi:hypothetical protein
VFSLLPRARSPAAPPPVSAGRGRTRMPARPLCVRAPTALVLVVAVIHAAALPAKKTLLEPVQHITRGVGVGEAKPIPQHLNENNRREGTAAAREPCEGSWVDQLRFKERRVYSQNEEDGVTLALAGQVQPKNKYFVEFGTESGAQINTRVLREQEGWTGLLMDGSNNNPSINLHRTLIKEETIVSVFKQHNVPTNLGLLSVDVDSYDYWILKAILEAGYQPDIIITEVNAQIGPDKCLTVPPASVTGKPFLIPGAINFGVSIPLWAALAQKHGYTMVYCEQLGVNCFYVKSQHISPGLRRSCPVGPRAWKPPRYYGPASGQCWRDNGIRFWELDCETLEVINKNYPAPQPGYCSQLHQRCPNDKRGFSCPPPGGQ